MEEAIHGIPHRNRTWRLVPWSPGANVVIGEWIFKSTTPMVLLPTTRLAEWVVASPSATASTTTRHSARWSNR
jgi:hypothetical protein